MQASPSHIQPHFSVSLTDPSEVGHNIQQELAKQRLKQDLQLWWRFSKRLVTADAIGNWRVPSRASFVPRLLSPRFCEATERAEWAVLLWLLQREIQQPCAESHVALLGGMEVQS